ncbi:MAG: hypothetical protein K2F78_05695, partial [Muribaculaceae bacterium]|nr:hypothetical protein [Muribaculaceae bacterium]
MIPAAPQSAAVIEQQLPQPSLLTGAIDFTLPVYTIDVDGFRLPISFRYHTSGIKVLDDPGIMGYGWNFLPALRVSRTIMGRPDELSEDKRTELLDASRTDRWETAYHCMVNYPDRAYDSQPDIFTIALPDRVLKRIHNPQTGKLEGIGDAEYDVECDKSLDSLVVTDPYGVKFIFGGKGYKETVFLIDYTPRTVTVGWVLKRIELTSGRQILLSWNERNKETYGYRGGRQIFDADNYATDSDYQLRVALSSSGALWNNMASTTELKLTRIDFPGGYAAINYQDKLGNGIDIFRSISIHTPDGHPSLTIMQHKQLCNGYVPSAVHFHTHRESSAESYYFEYNKNEFKNDADTYPMDWWGYYNGASNKSLTPPLKIKRYYDLGTPTSDWHIASTENRNCNHLLMKAGMLEQIKYPGGGTTTIEYEPHRFASRRQEHFDNLLADPMLSEGGGLRVKCLTMKAGDNDMNERKVDYEYGDAEVRSVPTGATFVNTYKAITSANTSIRPYPYLIFRAVNVLPVSNYMDYDIGELPLWYKSVTEIAPEGKTIYTFSDSDAPHNDINTSTFGHRYINRLSRVFSTGPQLVKKEIFKGAAGQYEPVQTEEYSFELLHESKIISAVGIEREYIQIRCDNLRPIESKAPDFKGGKKMVAASGLSSGDIDDIRWLLSANKVSATPYLLHSYTIDFYTERPSGKTVTYYDRTNSYTEQEQIQYRSSRTGIIDKVIRSYGSKSEVIEFIYPPISNKGIDKEMREAHVLAVPVSVKTRYGNATTITHAEYTKIGKAMFRPRQIKSWHEGEQDSILSPVYSYDRYGNLSQFTDADGCVTSYLHGYNGHHPVFKIEGLPLDMLGASQTALDGSAENFEMTKKDGALVTALTFESLVGLTSITTPWGTKTNYCYGYGDATYDTGKRLGQISIDGLGLVEEFRYSFAGSDGIEISSYKFLDANGTRKSVTKKKYDGLGRLSCELNLSARGKDANGTKTGIGRFFRYDNCGRLAGTTGSIGDTVPPLDDMLWIDYSYEQSQRNIRKQENLQGDRWKSTYKKLFYNEPNSTSMLNRCPDYILDGDNIVYNGYLSPGSLMLERMADEDLRQHISAKDKFGNIILRRQGYARTFRETYYLHDDFGRLRYIIPPILAAKSYNADDAMLNEHAYIYKYNGRDQLIYAKTPGASGARYVYSPAGRLVAESNAMLPAGVWRMHLYDKLGREVLTGLASLTEADLLLLSKTPFLLDAPSGNTEYLYDITRVPGAISFKAELVKVFDRYHPGSARFTEDNVAGNEYLETPCGLLTSCVNFHSDGNSHLETYYYNKLGQNIQTVTTAEDHITKVSTAYTYTGAKRRESTTVTTADSVVRSLDLCYRYDNADRNIGIDVTLSGGEEGAIESVYNHSGNIYKHEYYLSIIHISEHTRILSIAIEG